jgi:hypothetical protein
VTDPKSIKARHMPKKRDANAAGESFGDVDNVVIHHGCLLEAEEEEEAIEVEEYGCGVERGKGKGNLRVWIIMEQSSYRTLDWWSSSFWCIMILSF